MVPMLGGRRNNHYDVRQIGTGINETLTMSDQAEICYMTGFSRGPEVEPDT